MSSILDIQIEKPRHVTVKVLDINLKQITIDGNIRYKANFVTEDKQTQNKFNMSDAWIIDENNEKKVKALWINPDWSHIKKRSNIGRLLEYHNKESLRDFVGEEITAFPDSKFYLAIEGCPVEESDLEQKLTKEDLY